jgi:aldehyde:ferredoxin oxidoreductase
MLNGYMGKVLWVDLSQNKISEEALDEKMCRAYLGGYGLGARLLYSRQKGGVDPLGPENHLGLVTGPLTGSPAVTGCRFTAVGKSPLTGGWGDANSGGDFGPNLKFSGYDAVFIKGISDEPVYLMIDNGRAEIKKALHLWGKSTHECEELIQNEHGKNTRVAGIGPAGEKLSLISCLITHGGTAARSGLGAVMGSKRLKAVAVKGDLKIPLADPETAEKLRQEQMAELQGPRKQMLAGFQKYGTGGHADTSAHSGDTPVKNWGGVGIKDFPDSSGLKGDAVIANLNNRIGCWRCPIACRGRLKEGKAPYNYPQGARRPEYETLAAFGAMCLNNNAEAVAMANHLCDSYGLDTISTGTVIAFAMECFEQGVITRADTDGIDLTWGNAEAMIAMVEKMARREGFGNILADGVKAAAEKIGRDAPAYAVHAGGQELGFHDPKFGSHALGQNPPAAMYTMDATPGRHTTGFGPTQFPSYVLNAAGLCLHANIIGAGRMIVPFIRAVTGWDFTEQEMLRTGERIANIRHVFCLREGDNPLKRTVHGRIVGRPPQKEGPLAGVSLDLEAQSYWNLGALDWDRVSTKPSKNKLLSLGMDDIAEELWPPVKSAPGPGH